MIPLLAALFACSSSLARPPAPADGDERGAAADTLPRAPIQLRFPLVERTLFEQLVGVDHDPVDHGDEGFAGQATCTSYDGRGFPWCYDQHEGSDFLLVGGFDQMDDGSAVIVAAADGVVVEVVDGNYDRCHATVDGIDCDGHPQRPNYVALEHAGGWRTTSTHMMSGAMHVTVGQEVRCGDPLGRVGSSGTSSMPHLHLQLEDAEGTVIDPYAGVHSQPETWWTDQGPAEGLPESDCAG